MKRFGIPIVCAAMAAVLTAGVLNAQSAKDARVATVHDIMNGIHKVHCTALKKALDAGPSDDEAWEKVAIHAAMMNESGHVLMQNKRCPDGVWAGACGTLREGSANVSAAAKKKDLDGAKAAFKAMTGACSACHKKHKD